MKRQKDSDSEGDKCKRRKRASISCEICGSMLSSAGCLKRHLWTVHNQGTGHTFSCPQQNCTTTTKAESDMKRHLWMVHSIGEGPTFKCTEDKCDYVCKIHKSMKKHLYSIHQIGHGTGITLHCNQPECKFTCNSKHRLTFHEWEVHDVGDGKTWTCKMDGCDYKTKRKQNLQTHYKSLTSHRSIQKIASPPVLHCTVNGCLYSTKIKNGLNQHLWHKHDIGARSLFQCRYCQHIFKCGSKLIVHERMHTGEKPFRCDFTQCDYASSSAQGVIRHKENVHTKEGQQRRKHKEEKTAKTLAAHNIAYDREVNVDFKCALQSDRSQSFARIDFIIQRPDINTVFLVEVDEFSHSSEGYLLSCECRRMADATTSLMMTQPSVQHWCWVRFNPDGFTINGVKQKVLLKDKLAQLVQFLNTYQPSLPLEVKYMFYSTVEKDGVQTPIVFDMEDFPETLKPQCSSV